MKKYVETVAISLLKQTLPYTILFHLKHYIDYVKHSMIAVLSASQTSLKVNGHYFIACPVLMHLPHFSFFFYEVMIEWNCIAIKVNTAFPCPTTYLTFQED